jgi:tetratricopeptide (TPR) repeat protein
MTETTGEAASKQTLSEALRHADSNDLATAQAIIESGSDATGVAQRYADLAQALYREHKNVTQMLAIAKAGIAYCLVAAEQVAAQDPAAAVTLKTKAKAIAYNAAANSWPGWGDDGIVITPSHIEEAVGLAVRSLALVEDLKLGQRQLGTSQWLVGALHLAAGRSDDAIAALMRAHDTYAAGGERIAELLALGYLALARSRQGAPERSRAELEEICQRLQTDGSPQAMAFVKQLRTADRLL